MIRRTAELIACALACLTFMCSPAMSDVTTDPENTRMDIARDAQDAYARGITLEELDPAEATAAFARSADGWRRLIADGVVNGRLWTNLGNAELGAGRLGHAIHALSLIHI